ncbi:MAG: type I-C CRISPR-associated protein Cas7/Csd2 [Verrucomicrobia bacterium]|nr:MAG: type I-C CRISPR-associated protein Cas7/Csd2 [Verrucomicrobiota bacterium]
MSNPIKNRYDFVLIFDVQDGNPNGDPDAGNLPRVDAETGCGLVTDVCLKRKVRNYATLTKTDEPGYDIFVKERAILNVKIDEGYKAAGLDPEAAKKAEEKKDKGQERRAQIAAARGKMCELFYDIRTFGAVLSTGANAGQVRGPVQMTFGRSVDPIVSLEHCITRLAVTSEDDAKTKETEMGRKNTVPYGVYVAHGFVSAHLAVQTKFSEDDLKLFWEALVNMFEHDRSAARGLMATRKLIVFKHDTALGNAPAHVLFEHVKVERVDTTKPPRAFSDYRVTLDGKELPCTQVLWEVPVNG